MKANIYFDGACLPHNPNGVCTYGFVIKNSQNGEIVFKDKGVSFLRGNSNMAEYSALIRALYKADELKIEKVEIFGDSKVVVNQINGVYDVTDSNLISLHREACNLLRRFKDWKIKWFCREKNHEADKLSVEAFVEFMESKNREKVEKLIMHEIIDEGGGIYRIRDYLVRLDPPSCNCLYFKKYNSFPLIKKANVTIKCEHILLLEERTAVEMESLIYR